MKNFIRKLIIILTFPLILIAQSGNERLIYLEYAIDSDPGFGNANRIEAQGLSDEEFNFNIPLSQVPEGFHILHIRIYDSSGKFSETRYRLIYVDKIFYTTPDFDKVYYAIDNEINTGDFYNIPFASGNNLSINYSIDLTSLSAGLHTLFIMTKDINGKFSHREPRIFYCDNFSAIVTHNINEIEYFLDFDPGFGKGNKIPITPASTINTNYIIPLNGLNNGFHFLHIRSLDDAGRWSSTYSRVFYVDQNPAPEECIIKNMYYVINGTNYSSGILKVNSTTGTHPDEFTFDIDCSNLTVDSTYRISFFIETMGGLQSSLYENQFLVKFGNQSFTILYESGWNLLSIPVENPNMLFTSIFPNTNAPIYTFEGEYLSVQNIPYANGFWARFPDKDSIIIQGNRPTEFIEVKKGWNIIGGFPASTQSAALISEPANIITSQLFGYSGVSSYFSAASLDPAKGYWVKTNANGKINFTPNPNPSIKKIEIPENWNEFAVSDGINNLRHMYLAGDNADYEYFELPPPPPGNSFDSRFDNNCSVSSGSGTLKIISPSGNIIIEARDNRLKIIDPLTGKEIIINKGEQIAFQHNELSLRIANVTIPVEYKLFQNYPNPFNPETIIKFGLPEQSKVKIEIFNILGQRVTELLNAELEAGYYQIKFNGGTLASGLYIYSIKTNSFSDVKKMMLLK